MPPLTKTCPKMVPSHKGGSLCVKDVFAKKFLVPGEIPFSALAPARRAAAKARVDVILAGGDAAVRAARQATTGYRNGFTNSRRGSRQNVEMGEFSRSGKFDKSGRDSVAATFKLVHSPDQHCKYDRNENKRAPIS